MVSMGLGVSVVNPMVLRCLPLPSVIGIPSSPDVDLQCHAVRAAHRLPSAIGTEFLECIHEAFGARRTAPAVTRP
jgi:hypothetical protein